MEEIFASDIPVRFILTSAIHYFLKKRTWLFAVLQGAKVVDFVIWIL